MRLPNGRTVRIPYPKGVSDGYRVRLKGQSLDTGQTLYVDGGLWSQIPWPYSQGD